MGTGTNVSYKLISFGAFRLEDWSFNSNKFPSTFQNRPPDAPAWPARAAAPGTVGSFVQYVSLADGYTLGPANDYGADIVRLVQ